MKQLKNAIWITLAVALTVVVGRYVWKTLSWQEDYGEAEPLVQTIWPMAQSMSAYEEKWGPGPASLEDLESFDPELNVSALKPYDVTMNPEGRPRLFVRVNQRFAFEINNRFQPSWAEFTPLSHPPKQP